MWGKRTGYNSDRNFEARKKMEDCHRLGGLQKINWWWQNPRINLICSHRILKRVHDLIVSNTFGNG